jgi:hypothetical protein
MTVRLNGSTSGYVEIDAPAVAATSSFIFPTGTTDLSAGWISYAPTAGGVSSIGNGSLTGAYMKIGRTVSFWAQLGVGSTTTFSGSIFLSLPFTANSQYALQATLYTTAYGFWPIWCYASGNAAELFAVNTAGTYGALEAANSTKPTTLATNSRFYVSGTYESVS